MCPEFREEPCFLEKSECKNASLSAAVRFGVLEGQAFSLLAVNSAVRRTQARLWARAVRALSWPRERRGTLASRGDVHHRVGRGDKVGRLCQSARGVHRIASSRRALIAVLVPPALMCHMCPCHRPGCAADASTDADDEPLRQECERWGVDYNAGSKAKRHAWRPRIVNSLSKKRNAYLHELVDARYARLRSKGDLPPELVAKLEGTVEVRDIHTNESGKNIGVVVASQQGLVEVLLDGPYLEKAEGPPVGKSTHPSSQQDSARCDVPDVPEAGTAAARPLAPAGMACTPDSHRAGSCDCGPIFSREDGRDQQCSIAMKASLAVSYDAVIAEVIEKLQGEPQFSAERLERLQQVRHLACISHASRMGSPHV